MLDVTQKVFFGPAKNPKNEGLPDLAPREWQALLPLILAIFAIGFFPTYFRERIDPSVRTFLSVYNQKREALRDRGTTAENPWLLDEAVLRMPERDTPPPVATDDAAGSAPAHGG
jgi:NADH-quinone oxidoreductase subunit M